MAINPLLSLQVPGVDVGAAFSNALLNLGRIEDIKTAREQAPVRQRMLEAKTATTEAAVPTAQAQFNLAEQSKISSLATGAKRIVPDLESGDIQRVIGTLQRRRESLQSGGLPVTETEEAIQMAQTDPGRLLRISQQAISLEQQFQPAKTAFACVG